MCVCGAPTDSCLQKGKKLFTLPAAAPAAHHTISRPYHQRPANVGVVVIMVNGICYQFLFKGFAASLLVAVLYHHISLLLNFVPHFAILLLFLPLPLHVFYLNLHS